LFTQKDIDLIKQIVDLVKQQGFTIQGAKDQLKNKSSKKATSEKNAEVIAKLEEIKEKLITLRDNNG
jgi:DNA-binding transcriptional MerR regulator